MTPDEWQARQRAAATATVARILAVWRSVDPEAVGPSWDALLPQAADTVKLGQQAAAADASTYVAASVAAQVDVPAPTPQVRPSAFAGIASDGRPLETLLTVPASTAGRALRAGASPTTALSIGQQLLVDLVSTQVYDAGRVATGTVIASHSQTGGYRRQLRGATDCSRCVILAGKWFRWNQGFQRHPRCDCVHVPSVGPKSDYAGTASFDPKARFQSMTEAEQDRIFTKAGAQAIRDGADMNQVVNARRGMRTTTMYGRKIRTTTVGTSPTAFAGRRLVEAGVELERGRALNPTTARGSRRFGQRVAIPRLTPEQIYADSADRADAIRLLRRFGYIV